MISNFFLDKRSWENFSNRNFLNNLNNKKKEIGSKLKRLGGWMIIRAGQYFFFFEKSTHSLDLRSLSPWNLHQILTIFIFWIYYCGIYYGGSLKNRNLKPFSARNGWSNKNLFLTHVFFRPIFPKMGGKNRFSKKTRKKLTRPIDHERKGE